MALNLDTNQLSIKALNNSYVLHRDLNSSIQKLSSGERISLAEDDSSGMAIASSLNTQSKSISEVIKNANDGIGMMQTIDSALGSQIDIINQIREKSVQAATDTQSKTSLLAIQDEITKLLDELDHIADSTTYNGISMLSGSFVNKDFHTGIDNDSFTRVSIKDTSSPKVGIVRYETGMNITKDSMVKLRLVGSDGKDWFLDNAIISTSATTGIGTIVEQINKDSDVLDIKARASVVSTSKFPIKDGVVKNLRINGITVGNIDTSGVDGKKDLLRAINTISTDTNIKAVTDLRGNLVLTSLDLRGIKIEADSGGDILGFGNIDNGKSYQNYGRLTLVRLNDPKDIVISGVNYTSIGFNGVSEAEDTISMSNIRKSFTIAQACAMGAYQNPNTQRLQRDKKTNLITPGVMTKMGANALIDSADMALKYLSRIRSNVAAVQNKFTHTIHSSTILRTNLKKSESDIRDLNYAEETTNLNSSKLMLQANLFAISKGKSIRELVLELLR